MHTLFLFISSPKSQTKIITTKSWRKTQQRLYDKYGESFMSLFSILFPKKVLYILLLKQHSFWQLFYSFLFLLSNFCLYIFFVNVVPSKISEYSNSYLCQICFHCRKSYCEVDINVFLNFSLINLSLCMPKNLHFDPFFYRLD